jgi:hypothetical protein
MAETRMDTGFQPIWKRGESYFTSVNVNGH